MTAIFHELIEDSMEVFMDDFSIFGSSFDHYLKNLEKMLKRCEETNLVLNWEKCHFMVKEGIVLGHKVLGSGIEVDKAKIEAISKLPYPTNVKAIRSFLGHAGFYIRFIKDFSQIARPMTQLLEFDIEIRDKKGAENLAADHLSQLENPDLGKLTRAEIRDLFPEEQLMKISNKNDEPWYADYANYLASRCVNRIIRRCVAGEEAAQILRQCHNEPSRGHHGIATTARKVFEAGFYWPHIFRDEHKLVQVCDACQRARNISSREETPQKYIQVCEIFDVWGIDFMGHFPSSNGNKYVLVAIDYVSKWVEAQAFPTNDARNVVNFLKRLFAQFGIPKALISDRGTHFCNHQMKKAMKKYGVVHSTGINPQIEIGL
ncbi:reverse transcriptase domain-containing protein [Tanacetum coccineum]